LLKQCLFRQIILNELPLPRRPTALCFPDVFSTISFSYLIKCYWGL
jgi:hypothetical protein